MNDMTIIEEMRKAFETVRDGQFEELRGYWNVGALVTQLSGEMTLAQVADVLVATCDAAKVRGVTKSSLSKYAALVRKFKDFDDLTNKLARAGKPTSLNAAYALASQKRPNDSEPQFDAAKVAKRIAKQHSKAEVLALIAALQAAVK